MYLEDKSISLVSNNRVCPKCGKSHYIDESTSYCLSVYHMPIYKDGKLVNEGGETIKTNYKFVCLECGTTFDDKGNILKEAPEKVENNINIAADEKSISGQTLVLNDSGTFNYSTSGEINENVYKQDFSHLHYDVDKTGYMYIRINNKEYKINKDKLEKFIKEYLIDVEEE